MNDESTSPSGNAHGMPLALLLRRSSSEAVALRSRTARSAFSWLLDPSGRDPSRPSETSTPGTLDPANLVLVGVRSVDTMEAELLLRAQERGSLVFSARDVRSLGGVAVAQRILAHFAARSIQRIHVSFDVDSIDPRFAGSTGTRVPFGLTPDEVYALGREIASSPAAPPVGVIDCVEVNPTIGREEEVLRTSTIAACTVAAFLP